MNLIAFESPSYRRYFAGSAAAVNGMWILRVVVTWMAWDISGSATFVGLVAALSLVPTIVSGPIFGVLIDRVNIVHAAYSTNLAMMSATIIIMIALSLNGISELFLIILALYIGFITSAYHPMRLSMGPRLVERHQISSVSALAALNFNLARVISPFIAGVVIETMGIKAALLLTLILYAPNLIILGTLRPRILEKPKEYQNITAALIEGLSYIWQHHYLRLILITSALYSLSIRSFFEILPIIADGQFAKGAIGLGQLGAAIGAGSLIAAFIKTMGSSNRISALSGKNLLIASVGIIAMAIITTANAWPLTLISASCMGFAGTHLGVSFQSEIQTDLPDGIRGRVMSLWGVVAIGSIAVGSFVVGWSADVIGLGTTGLIISATSLIAILFIAGQAKNLR